MAYSAKLLIQGMRGPFLIASAIPVIFGGTLASLYAENFDWLLFILALIGIVTVHAAANMSNDYFDYKNKTDIVNKHRTVFSGGSGVLPSGKMSPKEFKTIFTILYLIGLAIGIYLILSAGKNAWIIISLIALGFTLTYFYSSPPINWAHRGLGELAVGLCFGPLPIFGTFVLLTGKISIIPIVTSIPIMMLIIAVLWVNEFPDVEADKYAEKKNLVLRLGTNGARFGYYLLVAISYIAIPVLILFNALPWYSLIALLTLPVGIKASKIVSQKHNDPKGIFPAMGMTILNHHLTGLLLIGGFIIEKFTK